MPPDILVLRFRLWKRKPSLAMSVEERDLNKRTWGLLTSVFTGLVIHPSDVLVFNYPPRYGQVFPLEELTILILTLVLSTASARLLKQKLSLPNFLAYGILSCINMLGAFSIIPLSNASVWNDGLGKTSLLSLSTVLGMLIYNKKTRP